MSNAIVVYQPEPSIAELEAQIDALGRPRLHLGTFATIRQNLAAAKAWDVEHPEAAVEYRRLVELLDQRFKAEEQQQRDAARIERQLRTAGAKLRNSGVGPRSLEAAADPKDTEALAVVKRWRADSSLTWLVLCGPKGVGKSVAATWCLKEAIQSGATGAFRRASELAKLSGFDAGAEQLEHLKRVGLLVLDDVGVELHTDFARAQFHELLDYRHEHFARTILTSNLKWHPTTENGKSVPGLSDRLGERLADRFAQAGRCVQLGEQPSMRRVAR